MIEIHNGMIFVFYLGQPLKYLLSSGIKILNLGQLVFNKGTKLNRCSSPHAHTSNYFLGTSSAFGL